MLQQQSDHSSFDQQDDVVDAASHRRESNQRRDSDAASHRRESNQQRDSDGDDTTSGMTEEEKNRAKYLHKRR